MSRRTKPRVFGGLGCHAHVRVGMRTRPWLARMPTRTWAWHPVAVVLALAPLFVSGCVSDLDTSYGRVRSDSVNGTGVLADLFRARGHDVRTAVRLTDELRGWAEVIVRFAPAPGPPPRDEADWYGRWLDEAAGRGLIYVPRDYDATYEYWTRALEQLPPGSPPRLRERIEAAREGSEKWPGRLPKPPRDVAGAEDWFAVRPTTRPPTVCRALGGPWAAGVDPAGAALTRHETLKLDAEQLLLSGDGRPLVFDWSRPNQSRVLVAANGTFLLNVPLTEPARWPLAERTVAWAGADDTSEGDEGRVRPKRVAFVEGSFLLADRLKQPSVFDLLKVHPFGWVAAQLLVLGLAGCLARAPRLGRARPDEPSGADRPVAHPEALGALLARTRQAREARTLLETYRRWRNGPAARTTNPP